MACVTPTFRGLVRTKADILILVEACLQGLLPHTARKPYPEESNSLVEAGNTFVYEENASGFQEWNDHFAWISMERGVGLEVFMCIPLILRKVTARIEYQNTTHCLVSYQPMGSSNPNQLKTLQDFAEIRHVVPRNGLDVKRPQIRRREHPSSPLD